VYAEILLGFVISMMFSFIGWFVVVSKHMRNNMRTTEKLTKMLRWYIENQTGETMPPF